MMQAAEAAVTEAARQDSPPAESDASANQQEARDQKSSQLPALASLRLLRQMQTLINLQSEQLLGQPTGQEATGQDAAVQDNSALTRMADRQQALAEQVARIREQLKQRK